jgi:hypothetical protein
MAVAREEQRDPMIIQDRDNSVLSASQKKI